MAGAGPLLSRFVRFGITGIGVTAVHVAVAVSLVEAALTGPAVANGVAFVVAAMVSYIINARFTFRAKLASGPLLRFLLVTGSCGVLSAAIAAFAEARSLDYRAGIVAVVVIVPVLSFLLHNFWSFRQR